MTDVMANFEVYEKIENTAKKIAKPWQYTTFLLGFLLLLWWRFIIHKDIS